MLACPRICQNGFPSARAPGAGEIGPAPRRGRGFARTRRGMWEFEAVRGPARFAGNPPHQKTGPCLRALPFGARVLSLFIAFGPARPPARPLRPRGPRRAPPRAAPGASPHAGGARGGAEKHGDFAVLTGRNQRIQIPDLPGTSPAESGEDPVQECGVGAGEAPRPVGNRPPARAEKRFHRRPA